ncbi:type II secretion system protein E, partial [Vibrio parahaemolyticus]
MPLHGKIGESGYCIQREVSGSESFEDALRDTLRGYPTASNNILLLGEVRDPTVAEL